MNGIIDFERTYRYKEAITVSFKYDEQLVSVAKSLEPKYFNWTTKKWEYPIQLLDKVLNAFPTFTITKAVLDKKNKDIIDSKMLPTEYVEPIPGLKAKLFKHQKEAISFLINKKYAGLYDEMGLGKSLSSLASFSVLKEKGLAEKMLVVCPNFLKFNWKDEIEKHTNLTYSLVSGDRDQKIKALNDKYADVYLINYESLVSRGSYDSVKQKRKKINLAQVDTVQFYINNLVRGNNTVLVLDEAHRIKNPNSISFKLLKNLAPHFSYRWVMTGSPIANSPLDAWAIHYIIDLGDSLFTSFSKFKNMYCILGDMWSEWSVVGYKNQDILRQKIDSISLRRKKDDILTDLPEKTFKPIYVELADTHMNLYKKLLANSLETFKSDNDIMKVKACMVRLIQMASNPLLILSHKDIITQDPSLISEEEKIIYEMHKFMEEDRNYKITKNIKNIKLETLDELLTTIIEENGRKVVLWTNFIKNIELLSERYKKYNPVLSYGAIEVSQRQTNVHKFQNDKDVKLFIANPMASKEGITLTASQDVIFFDRTYNLVDYLQAQDRCHRIGQFGTVVVYNMIAKGTIDELIHKAIENKKNIAGYLQNDTDVMDNVLRELIIRS